ncbi:MAG: hypothetical protein V7631_1767 [Massilia sp.]
MERIERLRRMANEALHEYQAATGAGGEPSYPQWAEDILAVCDQAEAATAHPARMPQRAAEIYYLRRHAS